MYKYYKNIGKKGESREEVLHRVLLCFDGFLSRLYNDNHINSDYKLEYLFDPVADGSSNFDSSFDISNYVNSDFKSFAFKFSWMNHPIILFVPKKVKCLSYNGIYNDLDDGVDVYDQAVLMCSFNPKAFSSSDDYAEFYSSERVFNSIKPKERVNVPLSPGISYYDVTTEVDPLWFFRLFYCNVSTSDDFTSYLVEDTSMFISVVNHTFIFGFVLHSNIDTVYYYVISSMDSYKYLPSCDLVGDYFVKYTSTCFKELGVSSDILHFTLNSGRLSQGDPQYCSITNAKLDANIDFSSLYCWYYMTQYFYSFKNVRMFDNLEHISLPINKYSKSSGIVGDNQLLAYNGIPYIVLSTPNSWDTSPNNMRLPIFPNDSHDRFAEEYASPLQDDYTYYTFPFPCDEQNTLNNHVFIYPINLYVIREPLITDTVSTYCKLDFMGITDVMYKNNRDIHELCINDSTYLVFESSFDGIRGKWEHQLALLVDKKLDPAI